VAVKHRSEQINIYILFSDGKRYEYIYYSFIGHCPFELPTAINIITEVYIA
jgi:hypothetical protein